MTSYIPEVVYGQVPGTYGQMGLIPWPAHMKPRGADEEPRVTSSLSAPVNSSDVDLTKKGEAYVAAALAEADGVFFVTVDKKDRQSIATSIEKLINMLDDLSPDADLEPDDDLEEVGDLEPDSDGEATALERYGSGFVASGADDSEDNVDLEPSVGGMGQYFDGGLQYDLEGECEDGATYVDAEPSLAATEAFNQDSAWHVPEDQWNIEDGELDAGDEPESHDGELEADEAEYDVPGVIWGGGSDDSGRVPA
jgi:hypothetical protein